MENGLTTNKFKNGQTESEGHYMNGKKDGKWLGWYRNGGRKYIKCYKKGKYDGKFEEWYDNGQKRSEGQFRDGQECGKWKEWRRNGNLDSIYDWDHYYNGSPQIIYYNHAPWDH